MTHLDREDPLLHSFLGPPHDMRQVGHEPQQLVFIGLPLVLGLAGEVDALVAHAAP